MRLPLPYPRHRRSRLGPVPLRSLFVLHALLCLPIVLFAQPGAGVRAGSITTDPLAPLPLIFRRAFDAANPALLYQGHGGRGRIGLLADGVRYGFPLGGGKELIVGVAFEGSNEGCRITGDGGGGDAPPITRIAGAGGIPAAVEQYREIRYHELYDGIDLRYYGTGESLKYDYIVAPGADPTLIRMRYDGIEALRITPEGDIEIVTGHGSILERRPYIYQIVDGARREVAGEFELVDSLAFGFRVSSSYDPERELVIDPVILEWSTFIGGTGNEDGYIYDIASDAEGNIYGTGLYTATFPVTPGVYDPVFDPGGTDCFIFKLDSRGTRLLFATYLGGTGSDVARGIALGADGSIYIGGTTASDDFPTTAGVYKPAGTGRDGFVARLSADGTRLLYATRMGGRGSEEIMRIRVDAGGHVTAAGSTRSNADFPTAPIPGLTLSPDGPSDDLFVVRFDPAGSALVYATRIGGESNDIATDLAILPSGETIVIGTTRSATFPVTAGAFDRSHAGSADAFVLGLAADGRSLRYATYLGGTGIDSAIALVTGPDGEAMVAGATTSADFPVTPGSYRNIHAGMRDAWISILDSTGSALVHSTLFGGAGEEEVDGLARDDDGSIYAIARTTTRELPVSACAEGAREYRGQFDLYLVRFTPALDTLRYAGYIGGASDDYSARILPGDACSRSVVISATTHSPDYPTTPGAYQRQKLNTPGDQPAVLWLGATIRPEFDARTECLTVYFRDRSVGECVWSDGPWSATSWEWDFGDGSGSSVAEPVHRYAAAGTYRVRLIVGCPRDTMTIDIVANAGVTAGADRRICPGDTTTLAATGIGTTYRWTPAEGLSCTDCVSPLAFPTTTTRYVVTADGVPGCNDTVVVNVNPPPTLRISSDTVICTGGSAPLVATSDGVIEWRPAAGLSCTDCPAPTAAPAVTTTYVASARSAAGCLVRDSVTVVVEPPPLLAAAGDTTICNGDSTRLEAIGNGPFVWSPAAGLSCSDCRSPLASPSVTTTFTVTTRTPAGCEVSDQVTVGVTGAGTKLLGAHIGREFIATPGDTLTVPIIVDLFDYPTPIASLAVTIGFDSGMMRLLQPAMPDAGLITRGTLLEGWRMTLGQRTAGGIVARFDAADRAQWISGTGVLLNLRLLTYVRSDAQPVSPWSDSSQIRFELTPDGSTCGRVRGDPGRVRLELCGLSYRLIEMGTSKYALGVGVPNPFGESTTITYALGLDGPTSIMVHDIAGRRVATLIDRHLDAGRYEMIWEAGTLPAGIYYIRMLSGDWSETVRMEKR